MHRAERVNPTTRSWIPPRTFFTQVRFCGPAKNHRAQGLPRPPPDRKTRGKKGEKPPSGPAFREALQAARRPRGNTGGNALAEGQTRPSDGPENRPRHHPEPREETAPPCRKRRGIPPPQPARQSARPVLKIPPRTSSQPPEHAAARRHREEGPVRARTPGAPTHPAGGGRRRRPPSARGSPTISERKNQTASSQPRRRAAPASPRTSRRGRCWMSPARGPAGQPAFHQPRRHRNVPHQVTPLPGSPETGPPRARVHHDRPPAGAALLRVGAPHHLDDPVHPLSRIGVGPEHQLLPEKPVADRRNPDAGRPALATPGHSRLRRGDRYIHIAAVAVETDLNLQARDLHARQTALQDNAGTPKEQVLRADPVLQQRPAVTRPPPPGRTDWTPGWGRGPPRRDGRPRRFQEGNGRPSP